MADIHAIKPRQKFLIARRKGPVPEYLNSAGGGAYRWGTDPKTAVHLTSEKEADALAARVAGGAEVAEVFVV